MPVPRHGIYPLIVGDNVILAGGGLKKGFGVSNTVTFIALDDIFEGVEAEAVSAVATGPAPTPTPVPVPSIMEFEGETLVTPVPTPVLAPVLTPVLEPVPTPVLVVPAPFV